MATSPKKALFCLCFLISLVILVPKTFAAEASPSVPESGTTGILPSNPFYFFKEWSRSIRRTLSFTDLKKAEIQLGVLNEQVNEIQKLNELNVTRREAIERALDNYNGSIDLLKTYLIPFRGAKSGNVGQFFDEVVASALRQYDVLQGLIGKLGSDEERSAFDARIAGSLDRIAGITALMPSTLEDVKKFRARLEDAVGRGESTDRELLAATFLERVMGRVPRETQYELSKLQHTLIQKWIGHAAFTDGIANANDLMPLLQVIDAAREKVFESETKNTMNVARQNLLDTLRANGAITEDLVGNTIKATEEFTNGIAVRLGTNTSELGGVVRGLVERARFQLAAAKNFIDDGALGNAYGQLIGATTAARSAVVLLMLTPADFTYELGRAKQYFDVLMERARAAQGILRSENLAGKIGEAEVQIAKLADAITKQASIVKMVAAMNAVEVSLGIVEQLIDELTK